MLVDAQLIDAHLKSSVSQALLLRSKFAPPPSRPDLVLRARLNAQLNQAMRYKCALVAAPAGFGKTTAISSWAAASDLPVAWVALDQSDNDPTRFWTYVISALDTLRAGIGEPALALLQAPQPPLFEDILSTLLNTLSTSAEPLALVLDDYHLIDAPIIHRTLGFLLDHMLPHMHLVIASRRDPPLALARERARGALTELRVADLRFTASEADTLLNDTLGQHLSSHEVQMLATRTEGWIAGLRLVALTLPNQPDIPRFIESLRGSDRHIVDYLVDEVLAQQPPELQTFLQQTSILSRFCGPLCDAVTGHSDSQALLEQLERHNLFIVPLDHTRQWYRYHQLFGEFLRARLQHLQPDIIATIHQRAACWYAENGMSSEAIEHALLGHDQHMAARLINQCADTMIQQYEISVLLGWLAQLSDQTLRLYPRLFLVHAWALMFSSQFDSAEQRLHDAEQVFQAQEDSGQIVAENAEVIYSELLLLRAAVNSTHADSQQFYTILTQADPILRKDNIFRQHMMLWMLAFRALAHGDAEKANRIFIEATSVGQRSGNISTVLVGIYGLGYMQLLKGNLVEARHIFEHSLSSFKTISQPLPPIASLLYLGQSKIQREQNNLAEAYEMAQHSIELGKRWGNIHVVIEAHLALARVQRAQGQLDRALETTRIAKELLLQAPNRLWMRATILSEQVRIWLAQNNLQLASHWANIYRMHLSSATQKLDLQWQISAPAPQLAAQGQSQPAVPDQRMPTMLFQRELELLMFVRVLLYQSRNQGNREALDEAQQQIEAFLLHAERASNYERMLEARILMALIWQERGQIPQMIEQLEPTLQQAEPGGYIRLFVDEGPAMLQALRAYAREPQPQPPRVSPRYIQALIQAAEGAPGKPQLAQPAQAAPPAQLPPIAHLSERELEVLQLVVTGAGTEQIAQQLMIAPGTVKRHLHNIYGKLDARNRVQVIERARALRLVQ